MVGEIDYNKVQPRKFYARSGWGKVVGDKYRVRIVREAHEFERAEGFVINVAEIEARPAASKPRA